jgi:hypothetical protein
VQERDKPFQSSSSPVLPSTIAWMNMRDARVREWVGKQTQERCSSKEMYSFIYYGQILSDPKEGDEACWYMPSVNAKTGYGLWVEMKCVCVCVCVFSLSCALLDLMSVSISHVYMCDGRATSV